MICTRLSGGLGNQLFQYAAGLALSERLNTELCIDKSFLAGRQWRVTKRKFELDTFKLNASKYSSFFSPLMPQLIKFPRLFSALTRWTLVYENQLIEPSYFFNLPINSYLIGHWQSQTYLKGLNKEILFSCFPTQDDLSIANRNMLENIKHQNSVGVHIRRGDYVTNSKANKFHSLLSKSYYFKAVSKIQEANKKTHFYIFSDDIEWCEKNLTIFDGPHTFVRKKSAAWEDLLLMGNCKHLIIANSSYSWWSAWLGDYIYGSQNRVVIAPKRWFTNLENNVEKELFSAHWIQI